VWRNIPGALSNGAEHHSALPTEKKTQPVFKKFNAPLATVSKFVLCAVASNYM
jgi:hypothetical protein